MKALVACHSGQNSVPVVTPPVVIEPAGASQRDQLRGSSSATSVATEAALETSGEVEGISDDPDDADGGDETDAQTAPAHPLDGVSDAELSRALREHPSTLGSASMGRPNAGALFNGVQLPENPAWKREDPLHAWGTSETVEALMKSLLSVERRFPNTPPVSIGHLSAQRGGPLSPHVSHQSGRDVDIGLYYRDGKSRWYLRASGDNLDVERTYWLIRFLAMQTPVEMILLDQSLISIIEQYAISVGESGELVSRLFRRHDGRPSIVRHARGHATHLHVRFFNPLAQRSGRRLMPLLVQQGVLTEPPKIVTYIARPGDTLAKLAVRYSTTMQAIQKANNMKTFQLAAGTAYRIPISGSASAGNRPVQKSARRRE
ncbi:MAG TPA: penicillin-insensitive murein endopeptidase [Polyangiaceae bacterium]